MVVQDIYIPWQSVRLKYLYNDKLSLSAMPQCDLFALFLDSRFEPHMQVLRPSCRIN
jgi:hypothetical protein